MLEKYTITTKKNSLQAFKFTITDSALKNLIGVIYTSPNRISGRLSIKQRI